MRSGPKGQYHIIFFKLFVLTLTHFNNKRIHLICRPDEKLIPLVYTFAQIIPESCHWVTIYMEYMSCMLLRSGQVIKLPWIIIISLRRHYATHIVYSFYEPILWRHFRLFLASNVIIKNTAIWYWQSVLLFGIKVFGFVAHVNVVKNLQRGRATDSNPLKPNPSTYPKPL